MPLIADKNHCLNLNTGTNFMKSLNIDSRLERNLLVHRQKDLFANILGGQLPLTLICKPLRIVDGWHLWKKIRHCINQRINLGPL